MEGEKGLISAVGVITSWIESILDLILSTVMTPFWFISALTVDEGQIYQ